MEESNPLINLQQIEISTGVTAFVSSVVWVIINLATPTSETPQNYQLLEMIDLIQNVLTFVWAVAIILTLGIIVLGISLSYLPDKPNPNWQRKNLIALFLAITAPHTIYIILAIFS